MSDGRRNILLGCLLGLLTVGVFLPVLRGKFLWDDDTLLYKNGDVTAVGGIGRMFWPKEASDYFPLTTASFYLEYRIFGENPLVYHVDNVLLHVASALLLWRILVRLRVRGAYLAALLFAVHPVAVESVAWIAERKNTLSLVFYLLTIWNYLRFLEHREAGRRDGGRWYLGALVFFLLALLAKTSVVMLPFVLGLLEWWRQGGEIEKDGRRGGELMRRALRLGPFFLLAAMLGVVTVIFQGRHSFPVETMQRSMAVRIEQAGMGVWFYLYKALVPLDLATFYPEWRVTTASALGMVPLILLGAGLAALWRWRRIAAVRNVFFGVVFFVINLAPVLGLANMTWTTLGPVADHFQYIALMGIMPLVAGGLMWGWKKQQAVKGKKRGDGMEALRLPAKVGTILVPTVFCVMTFLQAGVYASERTLWTFNVLARPQSFAAHTDLGLVLEREGDLPNAMEQWRLATQLDTDAHVAHYRLGKVYMENGEGRAAVREFLAVLAYDPLNVEALRDLGKSYFLAGQSQEALNVWGQILSRTPEDALTRFQLAYALEQLQRFAPAVEEYGIYLKEQPEDAAAHYNRGNCLMQVGKTKEAIGEYETTTRLAPEKAEAFFNLAIAYAAVNDTARARAAALEAKRLNPRLGDLPVSNAQTGPGQ